MHSAATCAKRPLSTSQAFHPGRVCPERLAPRRQWEWPRQPPLRPDCSASPAPARPAAPPSALRSWAFRQFRLSHSPETSPPSCRFSCPSSLRCESGNGNGNGNVIWSVIESVTSGPGLGFGCDADHGSGYADRGSGYAVDHTDLCRNHPAHICPRPRSLCVCRGRSVALRYIPCTARSGRHGSCRDRGGARGLSPAADLGLCLCRDRDLGLGLDCDLACPFYPSCHVSDPSSRRLHWSPPSSLHPQPPSAPLQPPLHLPPVRPPFRSLRSPHQRFSCGSSSFPLPASWLLLPLRRQLSLVPHAPALAR